MSVHPCTVCKHHMGVQSHQTNIRGVVHIYVLENHVLLHSYSRTVQVPITCHTPSWQAKVSEHLRPFPQRSISEASLKTESVKMWSNSETLSLLRLRQGMDRREREAPGITMYLLAMFADLRVGCGLNFSRV